ncbi:MAG: peptide chain release factor N(5)-glutamine methyltransferase [Clostridia bacterium]|nr:peptide chain release factor N(5)-glutamine methyltransferase [Clostridia bacterium]
MTVSEIKNALRGAGIENFDGEAYILNEEFCGEELEKAVARRIKREPLQYIIGKWEFFREEYFVSPACLIPRSDTEILVEWLVKNLPENANFLDLCTGSGCIAVSTAKNRPDTRGKACDISTDALEIAKKNAAHNGVSTVEFFRADVTKSSPLDERFDCIVSNPPYIRTNVVDTLETELSYEPRIALDGGEDGMDFYHAIVENFEKNLAPHGVFAFEMGYDQKSDAAALAQKHGFKFTAINDYGGNFRVAVLEKL